jgi:hypothetical protein
MIAVLLVANPSVYPRAKNPDNVRLANNGTARSNGCDCCAYGMLAILGSQGRRSEVWARPLAGGNRAAVLLNRGMTERQITMNWEDLGYPGHRSAADRDLWQHKELGKFTGKFSETVPSLEW